jgi:DNA-directed RNA polymerase beta subunit
LGEVKEGDYINPDMVIAETTDPVTGEKTQVRPKKWKSTSQIKSIRIFRSTYFGVQASRVRISCIASAPAQSGDKVFTRGAIKGVVRVIPDEMMPKLENGETIEAIVSPDSVVGRRAMSVYWEGMANWYAEHGGEVIVDHFKPEPSFKELVDRGYGDGDFLWLGGEKLPEKTWFAPIYFIRLDKISHQIVSFQNGEQPVNGIGLAVDKASAGGQKRDFAKGAAMVAKGMGNILETLIRDNLKAPHAIKELTKVLANADGVEVPTKTEIATG